ncbi:MAG: phosphatidate cytidylyltransferase [Candidatus Polarisedimenticolia bacterium]
MRRILTALAGIPILFIVIKRLPPLAFMVLVAVAVVLGSLELSRLVERRGWQTHRWLGAALAAATAWSFYDPRLPTVAVMCAAAMLVPLSSVTRVWLGGRPVQGELEGMATTLSGVMFIGLLMGYCVALLRDGGELGRDLTMLLFWVVWLADAGALVAGKLFGRVRLVPAISPSKTVEGAAGALVVALAAALAAKSWFFTRLAMRDAVALGLLLGLAGMAGDLSESLMKRSASVKDSGGMFPGHGGMLDRTDSLMFAAPVLFYYHQIFME